MIMVNGKASSINHHNVDDEKGYSISPTKECNRIWGLGIWLGMLLGGTIKEITIAPAILFFKGGNKTHKPSRFVLYEILFLYVMWIIPKSQQVYQFMAILYRQQQ